MVRVAPPRTVSAAREWPKARMTSRSAPNARQCSSSASPAGLPARSCHRVSAWTPWRARWRSSASVWAPPSQGLASSRTTSTAFFVANHAFELAAVFVIFLSMLWNIVFPVIGGLQTIPDDVKSAALVFKVRGWRKFWYITLPALFPFIVTGSLLAWAQGWTIVIVAEVLHTYVPNGNASQDLLGLGSLLVDANAQGKNGVFLAALAAMILLVTLLNLAVWQPLLHLSQRFRFD